MVNQVEEFIEWKLYFSLIDSFILTCINVIIGGNAKMTRKEKARRYGGLPYDGLLGDSNIISVLEEIIADPTMEYRPIDLVSLTGETSPTVRKSLKALTSTGLLLKDRTDPRHPVYRVNIESKKYLALNLLAYAVLDDKLGTDRVDRIIANYCDTSLRAKYKSGPLVVISEIVPSDRDLLEDYAKQSSVLVEQNYAKQNLPIETYWTGKTVERISLDQTSPAAA
jgi:hypothetical protein